MVRRMMFFILVVLATLAVSVPVLAAPPPSASVTGVDMYQSSFTWASCGVELSATFADIGHGGYRVLFGIHDAKYGTTITHWDRLTFDQTSATFQLGSDSPGGDEFDWGAVTLYRGGKIIDSQSIQTTVACP